MICLYGVHVISKKAEVNFTVSDIVEKYLLYW